MNPKRLKVTYSTTKLYLGLVKFRPRVSGLWFDLGSNSSHEATWFDVGIPGSGFRIDGHGDVLVRFGCCRFCAGRVCRGELQQLLGDSRASGLRL